ncbi:MAG TPA: 16S rRNA (guanine(966)-N(2))-methyltransferase RsmD [Propionibacteriaceae bacterium]|nr:16S rRNA (guanine(966)-N(2))-methyltransferase RsmD [Propionibacteriaceae bacterium]
MSRIIAGQAGGRRLAVPGGSATRPTTDRVREALFSSLVAWAGSSHLDVAEQLSGISVLDLFAGSGAVGLEAASRGADTVVLVERDSATARLIEKNIAVTGLDAVVRCQSAAAYVATPGPSFDLIFADPPYPMGTDEVSALVASLVDRGRLVDDGLVVVERSSRGPAPDWPAALSDVWAKRYGETVLYYARRSEPEQ